MDKTDGIQPFKFQAENQEKRNPVTVMSQTMKKKMQILLNKRLEKGTERMRARTPETVNKIAYEDVLEGPLIVDYLKALHFFKDEMDEESEDAYSQEVKFVDDLVSPLKWDSNTVVQDVFRVL